MEHRANEPNVIVNCDDIKNFNFTPWNTNKQPSQLFKTQFSSQMARVHVIVNTTAANKTLQPTN